MLRIASLQPYRRAAVERGLRFSDQFAVEDLVNLVVLRLAFEDVGSRLGLGLVEQPGEIETLGLPMLHQFAPVEHLHLADHLVEAPIAERGHQLAHFLGDEEEIIDHVLGLALEALAQHWILRGDADRTGVEVALTHHDAAGGDQRCGREAEFVGAEQGAHHHVAAGADAAIDLHRNASAQAVDHQRLMGLGETDLPG